MPACTRFGRWAWCGHAALADVVACVQYAAENEIPLHARGAGSGLAGESMGPGLILDFSHSMRRILACDHETVRVQPGVVCALLNRFLADRGRVYGPDPATPNVSTMGSVLALNSSGSHWLRYGSARDTVLALQVVLADGSVIEAARHPVDEPASSDPGQARRQTLVRDLASVLEPARSLIEQHTPKTKVNRSGYHLYGRPPRWDVGPGPPARGLGGHAGADHRSHGAHRTAAQVRRRRAVVLRPAGVGRRGALEIAGMEAAACDLMDRRLLSIARDADVRYDLFIPRDAEAMLLVEMQGETPDEVRQRMQNVVVRIQRRKRLAFDSRATLDPEEVHLFWQLARRVVPSLYSLKGSTRPLPFVEDIAVPPAALPDFLVQMQNVLKAHQVTASLFAHAAHGQLHIRPFLDLASPGEHQQDAGCGDRSVSARAGSRRHDQRRTRRRAEPIVVRPAAVRSAVRRVSADQTHLRSAEYPQSRQEGGRRAAAGDGESAAGRGPPAGSRTCGESAERGQSRPCARFRCSWLWRAATRGLHRAHVQRLRSLPHAIAR